MWNRHDTFSSLELHVICNSVRCMFLFVLFENDNLIVIYFLGIEIFFVMSNDNYYYIFSVSLFFSPLKTILFNMIDVHFRCFHCQNCVCFLVKKQDLIFLKWRWCFILELSMWCYENCVQGFNTLQYHFSFYKNWLYSFDIQHLTVCRKISWIFLHKLEDLSEFLTFKLEDL